ncbi:branched chain amino acid ABC transporter substrate-binding protein [Catellatospora methionotrophica]|uniref:Branched chain amino acid ABC transporter substrate-binding protein n=1 Tax=Catellatospora methionotrophica TaxID=121620 RepID=A0A8J3LGD2_9ACTN|nr:ABC transporter substrate-binding protein [Catellatospora methionotrophica]GIG12150.1 branched chain amino acid ABC transporter substrate-binding protein [Catellatospora methionotrophica]
MNPLRLACGLASVTLLIAGCTTTTDTPQPAAVGVLAPLTGPDAGWGVDAVNGARLAVDVVNDDHPELPLPLAAGTGLPGRGGARLSLAARDTAGGPEAASAALTSLTEQEHVAGLVLADSTEVAESAASQAQRLRVPLLDARSTDDYLTELGIDWYFRTGPSDSRLAEAAFALLARRGQGTGTITLVTESGRTGSAAAMSDLRELARRAGVPIGETLTVTASAADRDALHDRLDAQAGHTVVAWAQTAAGARAVADAVGQTGERPTLFGLGQGFRLLERPDGGAALLRAVPWSAELAGREPTARLVAQLYEQRFGRPMSAVAADAFTATIALAAAIDAAGSSDAAAIRTALRRTSLSAVQMIMPWDGVRFGDDGQNQFAAAVVEQWQDRGYRLVYPVELASSAARWSSPEPQP